MSSLNLFLKHYVLKHEEKIKRICQPLADYLHIESFCYALLDSEGHLLNLTSCYDLLAPYYEERLYLQDPHLKQPKLLRPGHLLIPLLHSGSTYLDTICQIAQLRHLFLMLQKKEDQVELAFFAISAKNLKNNPSVFMDNLDLLQKFLCYFRQKIKPLRQEKIFNVKDLVGKAFYEESSSPLGVKQGLSEQFLKQVCHLTQREQQCLQLFREGNSAQATAAILGLSQRTVESYFDHIKAKLKCPSKSLLLEWY